MSIDDDIQTGQSFQQIMDNLWSSQISPDDYDEWHDATKVATLLFHATPISITSLDGQAAKLYKFTDNTYFIIADSGNAFVPTSLAN